MTSSTNTLKDRLARYREIKLSVIGRKSGKMISRPVGFVAQGDRLYLLPVEGSDTQWYQNVLKNPTIRIEARGGDAEFQGKPLTDPRAVSPVVEKSREKLRRRGREEVLFEI